MALSDTLADPNDPFWVAQQLRQASTPTPGPLAPLQQQVLQNPTVQSGIQGARDYGSQAVDYLKQQAAQRLGPGVAGAAGGFSTGGIPGAVSGGLGGVFASGKIPGVTEGVPIPGYGNFKLLPGEKRTPKSIAEDAPIYKPAGVGTPDPTRFLNMPAYTSPLVDPKLMNMQAQAARDQQDALERQKGAGQKEAEARGEGSEAEQRGLLGAEGVLSAGGEDIKQRAAERSEEGKKRLAEMEGFSKDLHEKHIDPNRLWSNPLNAVRFTLGSILGGFLMGLNKMKSNPAIDQLNDMIDRDVAAQKFDYEQQKGELGDKQNFYSEAMKQFDDKDMALRAAHVAAIDASKLEIQRLAASSDSDVYKARADQIGAMLDGQKATIAGTLSEKQMAETKYHPASTVQVSGPGAGGGAGDAAGVKTDIKPGEVIVGPDGKMYTHAKPEDYTKAQSTYQAVHASADTIRTLLKTPITQRGIDWKQQYEAAQKNMAAAEIEGGGRGGKGIFEQFQKAASGGFLTWTPGVEAAVNQVDQGAKDRRDAAFNAGAQDEVRQGTHVTAKGERERNYEIIGPYKKPAPPASFKPAGE